MQVQHGGLYVSTISGNTQMDSMTSTMLSTLMANANISSFGDLAKLSIEQINSLIASVGAQLINEEATIASTNAIIAASQLAITGAGGLQDQFNAAGDALTIAQSNYDRANAIFNASQSTLYETQFELSTLSSAMVSINTDISTFQREYSILENSITLGQSTVDREQAIYIAELNAYNQNVADRSTAMAVLQSTAYAYEYASTLYEQVLEKYISTSTVAYALELDYISYSTGTYLLSQKVAQSTAAYYSSLLQEEQLDLQIYLSTSTSLHIAKMNYSTAYMTGQYDQAVRKEVCTIAQLDTAIATVSRIQQILGVPYPFIIPTGKQLTPQQELLKNMYFPSTNLAELTIQGQYFTVQQGIVSTNLVTATQQRQSLEATQSTIQLITLQAILDAANQNIINAQKALFDAQQNEINVQSTITNLSSQIIHTYELEASYISTLNALSIQYTNDLNNWYTESTVVGQYDIQNRLISTQVASTIITIQNLVLLSTVYNMSIAIYQSTYNSYSNMNAMTQSSISGYTIEDSTINGTISQLQSDINTLNTSSINAFADLQLFRGQFYSYKLQGLMNQAQEYQYSVQELNATVGAAAAQLLMNKLAMFTEIDTLNLTLTANPGDTISLQKRANLMGTQTTLQVIINAINPLDDSFNTIIGYSLQEQSYITNFINLRSQLTDIEISVLNGTSTKESVKSNYTTVWASMNATITSINSVISQKNGVLQSIYSVLNAQIPTITTLYPSITFPKTITVGQTPMQLQSDDPTQTTLSEYAILAPLDFSTQRSNRVDGGDVNRTSGV